MELKHGSQFNLLVSTGRNLEDRCIFTIKVLLSDSFPDLEAEATPFSGLVAVWVKGENREAIRDLARRMEIEPWHNDVIKRMVPVDEVVDSDPSLIVAACSRLSSRFQPQQEEKFRVRIRRRGSNIERMELIDSIADLFDNSVDLEHPDFEVRVEIIRDVAGVCFIRKGEMFPNL